MDDSARFGSIHGIEKVLAMRGLCGGRDYRPGCHNWRGCERRPAVACRVERIRPSRQERGASRGLRQGRNLMASLFSPYPYCGECSEVEITDEGIKIAETADIVRLRHLMRESGANPHGRSWFRRANLAE